MAYVLPPYNWNLHAYQYSVNYLWHLTILFFFYQALEWSMFSHGEEHVSFRHK